MMRARLITALVISVLLGAALAMGSDLLISVVLGLFVLAGAWEWAVFCRFDGAARLAYVVAVTALALACRQWQWSTTDFTQLMWLATLWWCAAFLYLLLAPQRVPAWLAATAGVMALVPTWLALVRMGTTWFRGFEWTVFVLALPVMVDTGGFFCGRLFGRIKLAPRISPGKTWEGLLGGMVLAMAFAGLGAWWFAMNPRYFIPLCLAAGLLSVVGDLTESLLKRTQGLKDSGRLFPGHGGVLDRIDSVTAAVPLLALGLGWLGVGA